MGAIKTTFNHGLVTARDRGDLEPGELQTATGIYYKSGDTTRAHKIGGRAYSGSNEANSKVGSTGSVRGLYLAQFDSGGTDYIFALSATGGLYKKTPTTGSLWTAVTGEFPTAQATGRLSGVHYNNRHYLCNGADLNMVALSADSTRLMGMKPPEAAPTASASTVAQVINDDSGLQRWTPEAANNYGTGVAGWLNTSSAVDFIGSPPVPNLNTFAYVTLGKSDTYTTQAKEQEWRFTNNSATYNAVSSRIEILYRLSTGSISSNPGDNIGQGGSQSGRFKVQVLIKYSTDGGNNYTTAVTTTLETSMSDAVWVQIPIPDNPTYASSAIRVKISGQLLTKGDGTSLRVADIRMAKGGAASNITTTTGFYYAVTEWDANEEQESAPSQSSKIVTMAGNNLVTLALPAPAQNSRATHWKIYRTPDGGAEPFQLGWVGITQIANTSWLDTFATYAYNIQSPFLVELLPATGSSGTQYYPMHALPPVCRQMFVHRGRIIGIVGNRTLAYSEAAYPESWPQINADNDFPLQQGDQIVAGCSVGDMIIVLCSNTVVTMMDVPSWIDGQFRATAKGTLLGAPGCVGQEAMAVFTAGTEPRVAWVSYQGVYVTDGHTVRCISEDILWSGITTATSYLSRAAMHWDRDRQVLILSVDSDGGGTNDRFYLIHMAPEHTKANGQPKWTGPHYGSIASFASGYVSGVWKVWGGFETAYVYEENNGTTDLSNSYSSTQVPLIVKTSRIYGDSLGSAGTWRDWGTYKARLRHTAAGAAQTVSVQWQTGRDSSGATQTVTKTPSIVSQQGDEFYVGIGGEWAEIQLTHTGAANWALLDLTAEVTAMGRSGRVA